MVLARCEQSSTNADSVHRVELSTLPKILPVLVISNASWVSGSTTLCRNSKIHKPVIRLDPGRNAKGVLHGEL